MFSGVSLADRLKAAVNQIEVTGSQLQARAIATANSASESVRAASAASNTATPPVQGSRPGTPNVTVTGSAKNGPNGDSTATATGTGHATTSQLAENALNGLRKSFNIARSSIDGSRPSSVDPAHEAKKEDKELKAMSPTKAASKLKEDLKEDTKEDTKEEAPAVNPAAEEEQSAKKDTAAAAEGPSETEAKPDAQAPLDETPTADSTPAPATPSEPPTPTVPSTEQGDGTASKSKKKNKKNKKKGKAAEAEEDEEAPEAKAEEPKEEAKDEVKEETAPAVVAAEVPEATAEVAAETSAPAAEAANDPEPEKPATPTAPASKVSDEAKSAMKAAIGNAKKGTNSPPPLVSPSKEDDPEKRLVDVERRFGDLSQRYTELLTQTHSANKIVRELTPLDGIGDADALEGWIRMVNGKVEMITSELTRLQNKVTSTESRMEEVRDTYRLESKSQAETISKLRTQLTTAENNLSAKAGDMVQLGQLRADLAKAQTTAKEEEEKRTKAISLLKTVRQKLVKVEKEKEEIEKDRAAERAQRSRALDDVEKAKAEREREVNNLRKGFERELTSLKERSEKELNAKKADWELEMITTKAAHGREIATKSSKITGLEATVKELHSVSATQFDTIQARQSEAESARAEMEVLQTRTKELEFELRESTDRLAMLEDAPRSAAPEASPVRETGTSAAEVARLLADAESRGEQRVQDMRSRLRTLERERNELEEDWAAKLAQRVKELEALRKTISDKEAEATAAAAARRERDARIDTQDAERRELERQMVELRAAVDEAHADVAVAAEAERAAREELAASQGATTSVQAQLDEAKAAHAQLRQNNKTLRDELRKVQSSAQLLEKQRGAGVGYWAQGQQQPPQGAAASHTPTPSVTDAPTPSKSPATPPANEEEEVNLEYLRNVILQFLEHKEMRPNLVRVLSVILRFTPQELRRLNAKLGT